ncbi:hypothetical protein AKJ57_04455 [candidate division MSBL1 archaeon SCGC-AAA259A05]|uniref:Carboxymuconolactone decarboxylase-like domain-containing protein n=1 Tax=candidate division MSBL1 archaeon SCGC-AAA259A05 TaxID=1698259 RepID=A0A133U7C2_9EURY|nr:hypothetical protein AKJ57_04455 [candidate division MSBL1 archaeon SCGC-AAA259A05]
MNTKKKLSEANQWLRRFGEEGPEKMEAFHRILGAVAKEEALSKRYKELIAIALSITQECEWCIAFPVKNALEVGATEEEILEAMWMALLVGDSPALMHTGLVPDYLEDFSS